MCKHVRMYRNHVQTNRVQVCNNESDEDKYSKLEQMGA